MKNIISGIMLFAVLTVITGIIYPLLVTGVSQVMFPEKAQGSLVRLEGAAIGSDLIAQKFSSPAYFWPRPSASDYQTVPSAASNLGPTSAGLKQIIEDRKRELAPYFSGPVPAELLLASGSGLDPELSPEDALSQVAHVAKARGLSQVDQDRLIALVKENTESPQFHIFGQARVKVLRLNLALDAMFGRSQGGGN